mmetsp:Transcript_36835/g.87168  ORF Transcript_36835/g.87168 Transcript_36835/m.87168 type:complete len:330 (-) Transcript_36835:452-1441(-)
MYPTPASSRHARMASSEEVSNPRSVGYVTWSRSVPTTRYGFCGSHMRLESGDETRPAAGGQSPARTRKREVLPQPLGPVTRTDSPGSTWRSRPSTRRRGAAPPASGAHTVTCSKEMGASSRTCSHMPLEPFSSDPGNGSKSSAMISSMIRCVNPASSSSLRPMRITSENAFPHRSMSSSVERNAEIRSASDIVLEVRKGMWMKKPPASSPWNLNSWSARSFRTRIRECHPRASTMAFSEASRSVCSASAPWRNATSSACASRRPCDRRKSPSRACSRETIGASEGDAARSRIEATEFHAMRARGRASPMSLEASARESTKLRTGVNECP